MHMHYCGYVIRLVSAFEYNAEKANATAYKDTLPQYQSFDFDIFRICIIMRRITHGFLP